MVRLCKKNDVLSTSFSCSSYNKGVEKITGFGMKNSFVLPSLVWKCFESLRNENDEPIFTYKDKYMRWFVRQSMKAGRYTSFNPYCKSKIAEKIFETISEKLNVKGNICEVNEGYVEYMGKKKTMEKEDNSVFDDYRKIIVEEKDSYIKNQLGELPIHVESREFTLTDVLIDFGTTSPYPSAMWDEKLVYPKIETGYASTSTRNDEIVGKFNTQTFTQDSAISKVLYYNPPDLIYHLPYEEEVKKTEINRMRNGYIIDVLNIVDIQEFVKLGRTVLKIYEGPIFEEIFRTSPFRKVIEIFNLRQKY